MKSFQSAFSLLQRIGKCMMLPVSVLPVAGILLGVGSANFSWLPDPVSKVMAASGSVIFGSLPLLFAIGVAIGLTENDGVAALAGTVGFAVFLASMGVFAGLLGIETKTIMGLPTIETGVFGGILVGFIAAAVFNRFYRVQLPSYLGFFAGKRSVPIITAFAAIALAAVLILIWPPIGRGIEGFSYWAVQWTAGPGVRHLRNRRARAHPLRPAPRLERSLLLPGRLVHGPGHRHCRARRDRAVHRRRPDRWPHDRGLPLQDVGASRGGLRHVACGAAGPAPEGRRHHVLGGAHRVPHRHHRAHRVRLPLRGSGALCACTQCSPARPTSSASLWGSSTGSPSRTGSSITSCSSRSPTARSGCSSSDRSGQRCTTASSPSRSAASTCSRRAARPRTRRVGRRARFPATSSPSSSCVRSAGGRTS